MEPNLEQVRPADIAIIGVLVAFGILMSGHLTLTGREPAPLSVEAPERPDPFSELPLEAKSVLVYDFKTGEELYALNAEAQLPLASLTKLMLAYLAARDEKLDADVVVRASDLAAEGDTGLRPGEVWRLKDLLGYTLVVSSNDGAEAVAGALAGITTLNQGAEELGLAQTYFLNPTGLDVSPTLSGSYGSARDITSLMAWLLVHAPEVLAPTAEANDTFVSRSNVAHQAKNTNGDIQDLPGLIASKTGFTDLAGGNLIAAFDIGPNRPVIIALLGSSYDGRFSDMRALLEATYASVSGS